MRETLTLFSSCMGKSTEYLGQEDIDPSCEVLPADRKEALLILGFERHLAARKNPVPPDRFNALMAKQMLETSVGDRRIL